MHLLSINVSMSYDICIESLLVDSSTVSSSALLPLTSVFYGMIDHNTAYSEAYVATHRGTHLCSDKLICLDSVVSSMVPSLRTAAPR